MIKGIHAMFYTPQADELRAFFRDKLELSHYEVGPGWLIFPIQGEIGCHPDSQVSHEISMYCDDIEETVKELKAKGVEFLQEIEDQGYGLVTSFQAPGGVSILLYQPKYEKP